MSTLFYIILGGLVSLMIIFVFRQQLKEKLSIRTWIFSLLAIALIAFGLAWAETSFHEYEIQAALMGILIFDGIGILFAMLAYRGMKKSNINEK